MADTNVPGGPVAATPQQTDTSAAATPTAPEPKTEQTAVDPKLEAFAKRERQLRKMQQQLQQEKAQWEAKLRQYETDYVPKSRLSEDPIGTLTDLGLDYNKLTEILLNNPTSQDPAIRALRAELKALKDAQSQAKQAAEEATQQQYQQALKAIGNEVKMLVDSDTEYEMIKASGAQDAVVELIEQTFNEQGYLMDVAEAAKQVENYLVEEAHRMAQLKKVQSRLTPKTEAATPTPPKQQTQQQQGMKTLTNAVNQQSAPKRLTDKERIERAKLAFMGKLNT